MKQQTKEWLDAINTVLAVFIVIFAVFLIVLATACAEDPFDPAAGQAMAYHSWVNTPLGDADAEPFINGTVWIVWPEGHGPISGRYDLQGVHHLEGEITGEVNSTGVHFTLHDALYGRSLDMHNYLPAGAERGFWTRQASRETVGRGGGTGHFTLSRRGS